MNFGLPIDSTRQRLARIVNAELVLTCPAKRSQNSKETPACSIRDSLRDWHGACNINTKR